MMTAQQVSKRVESALNQHGLLDEIDREHSQFLDLPEKVYTELVIKDAAREKEIEQAVAGAHPQVAIHPAWKVERFGEPDVARSSSGGIVAASAVPVMMRSGSVFTDVQVVVTFLAEQEMKSLLRASAVPEQSVPRQLADAYVASLLRRGGLSYWDPRRQNRLEIGYERALALYPTIKKSA